VVGVREGPTTAHSDKPRVSDLGQDHRFSLPRGWPPGDG
jgi:hypothetical protein